MMEFYNETIKNMAHAAWHQREKKNPSCPTCWHEATFINQQWYCLDCIKSFEYEEGSCPICS